MISRVTLFNKSNSAIAEIRPDINSVTWRLNFYSTASFYMPYSDAKCTRTNLALGNRVLIEFDNGLPDWGGVIDVPRRRSSEGVTITAYSGEKLLEWELTPRNAGYNGKTTGYIFERLIGFVESVEFGEAWTGSDSIKREYHLNNVFGAIRALSDEYGGDFEVVPEYTDRLRFKARWYEERGSASDAILMEGANASNITYDEQGKIANRVIIVGDGASWDDSRPRSASYSAISRGKYGLREYSRVSLGVTDESTLSVTAAQILSERQGPEARAGLTALDRSPGEFSQYDVGDSVTLQAFLSQGEWSVNESMRVLARSWDPSNACRVELK